MIQASPWCKWNVRSSRMWCSYAALIVSHQSTLNNVPEERRS